MTCENNSIVADILMRCLSTCELNHGYPCFSANQISKISERLCATLFNAIFISTRTLIKKNNKI